MWRAINQPIQSNPLALADARSVAASDLLTAERRYPHRVGETYQLTYNPAHRWFYFPEMTRDEALVFKVYDSREGRTGAIHTHTLHSAIRPSPADAPPRQSIEVRTFAFFALRDAEGRGNSRACHFVASRRKAGECVHPRRLPSADWKRQVALDLLP